MPNFMKQQKITLAIILFCFTAFGQVNIKELSKSLAKVTETLYASECEVSNNQYATFLNALKKANKTDLLTIAQIDTLQWRDKQNYNDPYTTYYHKHNAYKGYPAVNISHKGAMLYCEWLTSEYNSNPKRKFKKVVFRLPTEKEWILAAQGGDNTAIYSWTEKEFRNKKGQLMANFKRADGDTMGVAGESNDNADITAPVYSYWPNKFGIYCMSGNVAEMVIDPTFVKGGSWAQKSEFLRIDNKENSDGSPKSHLGFRPFVDIIEK